MIDARGNDRLITVHAHLLACYRAELQLRFTDPQCEVDSCRLCGFVFWIRKRNIVGEFARIFETVDGVEIGCNKVRAL